MDAAASPAGAQRRKSIDGAAPDSPAIRKSIDRGASSPRESIDKGSPSGSVRKSFDMPTAASYRPSVDQRGSMDQISPRGSTETGLRAQRGSMDSPHRSPLGMNSMGNTGSFSGSCCCLSCIAHVFRSNNLSPYSYLCPLPCVLSLRHDAAHNGRNGNDAAHAAHDWNGNNAAHDGNGSYAAHDWILRFFCQCYSPAFASGCTGCGTYGAKACSCRS